jgi:hypothetical protein
MSCSVVILRRAMPAAGSIIHGNFSFLYGVTPERG